MSVINFVKDHYSDIPMWMINLMGTVFYSLPDSKRYGKNFSDTLQFLREKEYLSQDLLDEMVNRRFVDTVLHAYYHVSFYKEYYDSYGVDISSIKDIRDITKLPTISKEDIRLNGQRMVADDWRPVDLMYITTSGSTGNPVGFYQPKSMLMTEWAYTMHIWGRVGCNVNSSRLVLRGKQFRGNKSNPNILYDPLRRELSCNIFNMTEQNMEDYCASIEKYKPDYIHGYMSAILMLAKYISHRQGGLKHQFKGILATSENVLQNQKTFVEHVFGTRVFSFYGHSERTVIAGECEHSSDYHIEPLYGYCELLDSCGNPTNNGEITGTGFLNPAMPLIRYRTGDVASWSDEVHCRCNRNTMRLHSVAGRWNQDMLINCDGAYISLTALNIHSAEFDRIIRYKLIQNVPGHVIMKIQPAASFTKSDMCTIENLLRSKTKNRMTFQIELTDYIPIGKNGKYRIIEQNIPINDQETQLFW